MRTKLSGAELSRYLASRLAVIATGLITVLLGLTVLWLMYERGGNEIQRERGEPITIHPDPRYLDRPDGVPVYKTGRTSGTGLTTGAEFRRRLEEAEVIATLGQAAGPPETIFGQVQGAAFHRSGKLFVLDSSFYEIRVFQPSGDYLTTVGGRGQGPGELAVPASLTINGDRLLVGESDFQLEVYEIGGDNVRHMRRITTDSIPINGVCGTEDGFIVDGVHYNIEPNTAASDIQIVHILDNEGTTKKSFGTVYRSPGALLNSTFSEALMACALSHDVVVLAPRAGLGEVRAYSIDGELLWILELEEFLAYQTLEYDTVRGPRYSNVVSPEGLDRIESIQLVDEGSVLVQVGRVVEDDNVDAFYIASVKSYLVDVVSGQGTFAGTDIPVIIAVDDTRIATLETVESVNEPYPRVQILQWSLPIDVRED